MSATRVTPHWSGEDVHVVAEGDHADTPLDNPHQGNSRM
jgi:hypothetical protein